MLTVTVVYLDVVDERSFVIVRVIDNRNDAFFVRHDRLLWIRHRHAVAACCRVCYHKWRVARVAEFEFGCLPVSSADFAEVVFHPFESHGLYLPALVCSWL